jgi:hypothetical protein
MLSRVSALPRYLGIYFTSFNTRLPGVIYQTNKGKGKTGFQEIFRYQAYSFSPHFIGQNIRRLANVVLGWSKV